MQKLKNIFHLGNEKPKEDDSQTSAAADTIIVPDNTLGLHVHYPPEGSSIQPVVDIVAVHGLNGDAFKTWTEETSGSLWLRDLLPKSEKFKQSRIMTYGYDARAFLRPWEQATTGRTFTFAEALLNDLADKRGDPDAQIRPIIFVGHSLGGIVIKAALIHAKAREAMYGDILRSTQSIVFFGTPHQGSDVAVWAGYLGAIGKPIGARDTVVSKELQRWSKPLVEQTTLFSEIAPNFAITTFYESLPFYGVIVVPEGSARMGQKNERIVELNANHHSICKFLKSDPNYSRVLARFEAIHQQMALRSSVPNLPTAPTAEPSSHNEVVDDEDELHQRFEHLRGTLNTDT